MSGSKSVTSSPLEKLLPIGSRSVDYLEGPESYLVRDQKEKLQINGAEGAADLSRAPSRTVDHNSKTWSNLYMKPASSYGELKKTTINGALYESSLFSSSFSEIFNRKCEFLFLNFYAYLYLHKCAFAIYFSGLMDSLIIVQHYIWIDGCTNSSGIMLTIPIKESFSIWLKNTRLLTRSKIFLLTFFTCMFHLFIFFLLFLLFFTLLLLLVLLFLLVTESFA